jgi:hypothetical protein
MDGEEIGAGATGILSYRKKALDSTSRVSTRYDTVRRPRLRVRQPRQGLRLPDRSHVA